MCPDSLQVDIPEPRWPHCMAKLLDRLTGFIDEMRYLEEEENVVLQSSIILDTDVLYDMETLFYLKKIYICIYILAASHLAPVEGRSASRPHNRHQ